MSSSPDPKESDVIEDEVISTDGTVISQAFRWSLLGLVLLAGLVFMVATLLSEEEGEVEESERAQHVDTRRQVRHPDVQQRRPRRCARRGG